MPVRPLVFCAYDVLANPHAGAYAAIEPAAMSRGGRGEPVLGKSRQFTLGGHPVSKSTDVDLLEQTVSLEGPVSAPGDAYGLDPVPVPPEWILEGNPRVREKSLACSTDDSASAHMWDCTSGRFRWEYRSEAIVHVLEGSAILEIAGVLRRVHTGDTHVFPAGSPFRWTVPNYLRIVTFQVHASTERRRGQRLLHGALTGIWRARRSRS